MELKDDTTQTVESPVPPVAQDTQEALEQFSPFTAEDYETYKQDFIEWLLTRGKNTYKREGYAEHTTKTTHYKVDEAYRWLWNRNEQYTKEFTPEDATDLLEFLVRNTTHPETYVYTFEKCLRRLFKFQREELRKDVPEWEHDIPLDSNNHSSDKDKFYPEEMAELYETSLSEFSIRNYRSVSVEERDRIKRYLAQRLEKPKAEIGPDEFAEASSWKVPSIIAVVADTGLRPIEVGRAKMDWFDLDHGRMLVPKEESTKNDDDWECALSSRSANALRKWKAERSALDLYAGRDAMWLTRTGNEYGSSTLNSILRKLMERSDIDEESRKLTWYSFRHGAASMWAEKEGIYVAKEQVRHKSVKTTLQYTRGSVEAASKAVDRMW
ncbi:site-specific integrase [Halorubrum sp. GN11_10-6_MGM]|uniref:tyrosine-type recombinase/integrase n=1 Tax=Halorubrum sp. GN11_10-6_MGM TaxID=2518112 RepID=UPI0010F5D650|nr:site-specific integrase [Halorubrum sp. GN11_10-6_MGM]TKX73568.1 site-specific integrase [Halorubrum sp. GN11_10-6_MGM]